MVPVTGVALLMQRLMATTVPDRTAFFYFIPVLAPMTLYGWLAIRWAVEQFHREEVLFREAERLDWKLWLRHLWRDKAPLPSTGQAIFCFGFIVLLRWLSFGFGAGIPLLARSAILSAAFLVVPAIIMAILLTTRPRQALGLVPASPQALGSALLLSLVLFPPLAEATQWILGQFPGLKEMLKEHHPLAEELLVLEGEKLHTLSLTYAWTAFLTLAVVPAVCEELVFRGLILNGLRRRYEPWKAIGLSSFFFAVYHMNVFQFLPALVLGIVLGMLAQESRSLAPAILFHLVHNGLPLGMVFAEAALPRHTGDAPVRVLPAMSPALVGGCVILALLLLWRLGRQIGGARTVSLGGDWAEYSCQNGKQQI
jgi:sodium transport system permease protein